MMYLTQLTLDLATAAKLRIRDAYDWHQRAWQCFPGRPTDQRDFLTRLDRRAESFRFLILSLTPPVQPPWCPSHNGCWRTKPIPDAFFTQHRYAFQLRANPTKKVLTQHPDHNPKKQGRRIALDTPEELLAWITRKGIQGGFTVDPATLRMISQGRQYFAKSRMRGLHHAVDFEGILTITDSRRFRETFTRGIGTAKAFGFGLLVIAPTSCPVQPLEKGARS